MDIGIKDISEELVSKIDKLADQQKRSRNQQIIWMLEQLLNTKVAKTGVKP